MSPADTMFPSEMRERYLRSLSPIERMDYELACAREKRACAQRLQEQDDTDRLLRMIEARAAKGRRGLTFSARDVQLLAAELRRLKGARS